MCWKFVIHLKSTYHGFLRVWHRHIHTTSGSKHVVRCTCYGCQREGVPCKCFFWITENAGISEADIVDLGMVDPRYLRWYNTHYGKLWGDRKPTLLAKMSYHAYHKGFVNDQYRNQVSKKSRLQLLQSGSNTSGVDLKIGCEFPILDPNTSEEEFSEERFIMKQDSCTT